MIRLRLPLPPPVNNLYATNKRTGGRYNSRRYLEWIRDADGYFMLQKREIKPITGPYKVTVMLPTTCRGDVDGYLKAPIDYLVSRNITPDDLHCISSKAEKRGDMLILDHECLVEVVEVADVEAME